MKSCVLLQLGSRNLNSKGYVSTNQTGDLSNVCVGNKLKTRILHYDYMEKVYICSLKE